MACTEGRKYCWALTPVDDLIGGESKIKTRYGTLCDEGSGTAAASQVAYVNVSEKATGGGKWAQTGWGRERDAGGTAISRYRYAEVNGTSYNVRYDTSTPPADDSEHVYRCDLDKATGKWTFSDDGSAWCTFTDTGWKDLVGKSIQWTGEIFNKEDEMPGTSSDKCSFTGCKQRKDGEAFKDANITSADSDDSARWGAERVSATAVNYWDKGGAGLMAEMKLNDAVSRALAVTGLEGRGDVTLVQRVTIAQDSTPFVGRQLEGKTLWCVDVENCSLREGTDDRPQIQRHLQILVDPSNGSVVKVATKSEGDRPDLLAEPLRETAEQQMEASGERYLGFLDGVPRVTWSDALNSVESNGIGNPFEAHEIISWLVEHSETGRADRPCWIVLLRGIPPLQPRGFTPEEVPEWKRNRIRNVVDAETGKTLFATTVPQVRKK